MSGQQRRRSADEFLAELEQKPAFVERQRQRMADRAERRRSYEAAAAGLLADLEAAGFHVETLADLRRRGEEAQRALPALVKWLPDVTYAPLKRDLIATLGSRWARHVAARPLIEEFCRIDPNDDTAEASLRWSIGDALERVADETVLDDIIAIATDTRHGSHRGLVVTALGNMGKARDRVVPVLLEVLRDEDVAGYAVMGLGKLRAREARAAVEPFVRHREAWVREEAKKALARLNG
jgi:HEAT repeat protein